MRYIDFCIIFILFAIILRLEIAKDVANILKKIKDIKRKQQLLRILLLVKKVNLL